MADSQRQSQPSNVSSIPGVAQTHQSFNSIQNQIGQDAHSTGPAGGTLNLMQKLPVQPFPQSSGQPTPPNFTQQTPPQFNANFASGPGNPPPVNGNRTSTISSFTQPNGPVPFAPIRPAASGLPPPPMAGQPYQKATQQPPPSVQSPGFPNPPVNNNLPPSGESLAVEQRPGELPVPFRGQAQYSHQLHENTPRLTPNNSEPASQKSSRATSPIPGPTYDALESQFTPSPGTQRRPLPSGHVSPASQLTRQYTPPQSQSPLNVGPARHSPSMLQNPQPRGLVPPQGSSQPTNFQPAALPPQTGTNPQGGLSASGPRFPQQMPPFQPGFPPSSQPGFPTSSQPGFPPSSQPGLPPSSQPRFPPSQPGFPPSSQSGFPPSSQPGFSPSSQPGFSPSSQPGFPPSSQPGFPPSSQPGFPPSSQPGFPPTQPRFPPAQLRYPPSQPGLQPSSQARFPPSSQPGFPPSQPRFPPSSQPGIPPLSQPGFPSSSQPGFPPSSQPGFPPPSQPGFPPPSQPGFPPSSQPGFPPSSQPGFPPSQSGFPPSSQPGFPPSSLSQPGFPPPPSQPRFPQSSQPGFPPSSQTGFPPQSMSAQPGFPPQSMPGLTSQMPPQPGIPPPMAPGSQQMSPPTTAEITGQSAGVTGRRHYPQVPNQSPMSHADGMPAGNLPAAHQMAQAGDARFMSNNVHHGGMAPLVGSMDRMQLKSAHTNLLQDQNVLSASNDDLMVPNLPPDLKRVNCTSDLFSCTLTTLPKTQALLKKSRLPLGILIHPFKDLTNLPVIQSSVIVRCRSCRTYINPFVAFVDSRHWKCNLCYRVNELPEEFSFDPATKTYGEPQRRPEVKSSTIEFIAPSEYMLRPPQPAIYLFVLEVSFNAIETGYLRLFCHTLQNELRRLPGDSRTQVGLVTFDSSLHFYNLAEGLSQPQMLIVSDVDDVFLPTPDSLLVNLDECRDMVCDLLDRLPGMFEGQRDTGSALGPALQASYKLMSATGGRVTVFQSQLPTVGPGALQCREDPNERAGKKIQNLGPATDFYKKLALECSAQQIAVDMFLMNAQYADIASIAGISKYSGGCLHYFASLHTLSNATEARRFQSCLRRYLVRKIGFESVMRVRCTRGLAIHTFHGNFFVRSPDLLSLPNINPDAGFGMQLAIEDNLEGNIACFQAALLYTSSKGERRIRVHTMCTPVSGELSDVLAGAHQQNIISLIAKMAVDRSLTSLGDAREALINAAVDMLGAYGSTLTAGQRLGQLPCPRQLCLVPLYVLALLKSRAFRVGTCTKLDDRVFGLEQMKTLPVQQLIRCIHPDLYPVHLLNDSVLDDDSEIVWPAAVRLSSGQLDRHGAYLMDTGSHLLLWVGAALSDAFCVDVFGQPDFKSLPDGYMELPEQDNPTSEMIRNFVDYLNSSKPYAVPVQVIREDSRSRHDFLEYLIEDRSEATFSYYEFLQHLQKELQS